MSIQPLEHHLKDTMETIQKYQTGELRQIKTNREWLDREGGLTPRSILTIVGASFSGKSTELENLKADIMDVNINPDAGKYVWLSNSFEMTNFATTLRDLKKELGTTFKDILGREFTTQQREVVVDYYKGKVDGRFFINQIPQSSKDFIKGIEEFLVLHQDKDLVAIDLDHIALIRSAENNKKLSVDEVIEGVNELKNKYRNFLVIFLSQLNRSILGRLKENSNECQIRRDDVYMSDTMFFTSDYVYGLQNAYYLGIEEYRKINPEKYPHLKHRFTDEDKRGKVSLYSNGCIFIEVLKDRMSEPDATNLFTIEIKALEKKPEDTVVSDKRLGELDFEDI